MTVIIKKMRCIKVKEFFSNAWVVSIVSGIIVFIITNAFIMFQDKKHNKKQVFDANVMILNHLRSYVVDNGLPQVEIIEALKYSIAREYNIRYEELLTTTSVCEDLTKDLQHGFGCGIRNKMSLAHWGNGSCLCTFFHGQLFLTLIFCVCFRILLS